jgi:quinol monooxygenase YgiN
MIIILGRIDVAPEDIERAKEAAAIVSRATVEEDGCLHYAYAADLNDPNRLQLSEWWRDQAALEAHFIAPHILTFRQAMSQVRVIKRDVKRYEVSSFGDLNPAPR